MYCVQETAVGVALSAPITTSDQARAVGVAVSQLLSEYQTYSVKLFQMLQSMRSHMTVVQVRYSLIVCDSACCCVCCRCYCCCICRCSGLRCC